MIKRGDAKREKVQTEESEEKNLDYLSLPVNSAIEHLFFASD